MCLTGIAFRPSEGLALCVHAEHVLRSIIRVCVCTVSAQNIHAPLISESCD
jgi:hypothetical protein